MALTKLRRLASYVVLWDLPAHSRCTQHVQATSNPLLTRTRNARLSSNAANTQPSSSSNTAQTEETTSDTSPQAPLDQPSPEELENAEPWMAEEIRAYFAGRRRLAKMMGRDPETFTDKDVAESLRYLLPSALSAKDARPFLKHPSLIFPKRAESAFSSDGRPLESAFYTGSTGYQNLVYEIFRHQAIVEGTDALPPLQAASPTESSEDGSGALKPEGEESDQRKDETDDQTEDTVGFRSEEGSGQSNARPLVWLKKDVLSNLLHEELSDTHYEDLIKRLVKLAEHPQSNQIKDFLDQYRRPVFVYRTHAKIPQLNSSEEAIALGRRKTSTARVVVKKGHGFVTVNGLPVVEYFPRIEDRHQVLYPFMKLDLLGAYDVTAKVWGGGTTGQAGAIRLGISKALLAFPGDHGDKLEADGLLVRDPRMVERKKPGQKKARKKFTWVKR